MYKNMYYHLFNAVSDALKSLERGAVEEACGLLKRAQQETEELYLDGEEEGDSPPV